MNALEKAIVTTAAITMAACAYLGSHPAKAETRQTDAAAIIWAIDDRGNAFIAGSGDTCRQALKNVVWPKHMIRFACQKRENGE